MKYPAAQWLPSPNYNRGRSEAIDLIVIHQTDGQARFDRAVEHLRNADTLRRVSAHFLIGQAGDSESVSGGVSEIAQLVNTDDTAWHTSGWNKRSVGIEHIARTPRELGQDDPGLPLAPQQLSASAKLVAWLLRQYPAAKVVPHCSCPTTTHLDCGRDAQIGGIWPWSSYMEMIRQVSVEVPVSVKVNNADSL